MSARRWRQAQAFTLLELLLVMVILTVLAAIVVPQFVGRSKKAQITATQATISSFDDALSAFETDCGRYPTEAEGLNALVSSPGIKGWEHPYIKGGAIPLDPWGHPYIYHNPGQHNTDGVDVYSCGPSGQDGGPDNIGNWTVSPQ